MELYAIIAEIANRADDFLAGADNRAQGRAGVAELLTMDYPWLNPADRAAVTTGVMALLEAENFFGVEYVSNPFTDEDDEGET